MEANNHPRWIAGTNPDPEVHVVGGGLAGLVAASVIARSGRAVVVHESRNRLGGRATTDDRDGFLFNQGPHAFYLGGPGEQILRGLGVAPVGVSPSTAGAKMVRDARVHIAPGTPGTLARTRLLGVRDKASLGRFLGRLPKIDPAGLASTPARAWVDDATDRPRVRDLLLALIRLTSYGDAADVLSADVAVTQLQLGLGPGVLYLERGWQQLVERLAATPGVRYSSGNAVRDVDELRSAAVIVAAGSPAAAANLVGVDFPSGPEVTVASLDLGLTTPPENDFVLGIDEPFYLSRHGEAPGMAPHGRTSISVAEYHAVDAAASETSHAMGTSDVDGSTADAGHRSAKARLRRFAEYADLEPDSVVAERFLRRMTVSSSIPTARTGGLPGRHPVEVDGRPDVFVAGDWVGSRGFLADAVIASGHEAARAAIRHLERKPALR